MSDITPEAEALARLVRSRFPDGNLVLSDPTKWLDPTSSSVRSSTGRTADDDTDFQMGWWSALTMVAQLGEPALNDFEHGIATKVAELASDFIHLVGNGETAAADFAEILPHLHALQQTVMAQAAARAHPGRYRALGEEEELPDEPVYRRIEET